MKADRLISILMLLQVHKQLTANDLAKRLEVSVRTIYRDIESLSSLGIPIFTERGTNGGIKLLGDYKTTLSGMNKDELYSLFVPTGDKVLDDLGIEKLKDSTMIKLLGNSSTYQMNEIKNIQNYIFIDMYTWGENPIKVDTDILSILQEGIWNSKVLNIVYRKINETKDVILNPLGLVCKRGIWYLIGENNEIIKTYKVSNIESALLTDTLFNRPKYFNLEKHWKSSTSNFKSSIPKHTFTFKVNPSIVNHIKARKFISISNIVVENDNIYMDINFDSIFQGIEFAFGYGKDIEIIYPIDARAEIKKKSYEITKLYSDL
ncbi:WYL domain-containing protein [Clostridium perfringens]|uniref:YafY family transcriptional regulator n=4 Tax=Clostridium perfringens TaxID=1502 RepID=A0AAP6WLU8_CLOPF|nr:YafY family protein [Clostridium perfringens]EDT22700.1 transcription regulator [Clostridium perfringens B str. ATCC 3626]EDT72240.1 transcription regulator [Clostridium perfringens D str. JGS1721]EHK2335099.1 YafY family transcriptional regulator [Clostridium perfringens]ELC8361288.1 YafY family transcriptional regulator [Clostridium perfringens]ELC8380441.1 YafY family transcriptional regulator [Clostridium perfringens]